MITFDAFGSGGATPGSSISYSHTCGGSDRALLVGIVETGGATGTISSITYNSVAMTEVVTKANPGNNLKLHVYALINPASGANTLAISLSSSTFWRAVSASYNGVIQTGQPEGNNTAGNNSGTSIVTTVSTVTNTCWHISFGSNDGAAAMTGSTGVVSNRGNLANIITVGDSNGEVAVPYSMTWTHSSANNAGIQVALGSSVGAAGGWFHMTQ